jgi:hypothetical protein
MQRHDANITALLAGLLFAGIGVYGLVADKDRVADALHWVWPITLLVLGVALLVGSRRAERMGQH